MEKEKIESIKNSLERCIGSNPCKDCPYETGYLNFPSCAVALMKDALKVIDDSAEVVRCKDCKWWKTTGCWFHQPGKCVERNENDFCSDGVRRKENA